MQILVNSVQSYLKCNLVKENNLKILILGGDGYLGWPTAMYFSAQGHNVCVTDNFSKRRLELELGTEPLINVPSLHSRVDRWNELSDTKIMLSIGDLLNPRYVYKLLQQFKPEAIIHYAEQPSAPYSMIGREQAVFTQHNNVIGNLNLLFAMKSVVPTCHLVKLGTMGEYGTPNIDIEEGYIEINHNGRNDILPFPKKPGSFYHLSKVHDSHNIMFACNIWGLKATDLNQGVVYGIETKEINKSTNLHTSFHYDHIFGTVLNRFCVQTILGRPLTVYGEGNQTRGYLNILDTIQCVDIAVKNPASEGEFRVFNQFTEKFSVNQIAEKVKLAADKIGIKVEIEKLENPRIESEEHYYNPKNTNLHSLGLSPTLLNDEIIINILEKIKIYKENIIESTILPNVKWNQDKN